MRIPPNSTPCMADWAGAAHCGGCGGCDGCGGCGCCCCCCWSGGRMLVALDGGGCCCASMPVMLPYTWALPGSARRRCCHTVSSSVRKCSFSSWALRLNSTCERNVAFSLPARSCALLRFLMCSMAGSLSVRYHACELPDIHLVRISHLLDLLPGELGKMLFSSSKRFFISLLRFRSAILWLTRSSGVRL